MPKVKATDSLFSLRAYANAKTTTLQVVDNSERSFLSARIEIPVAIMYRLYHLGRAYDLQHLKLFRPNGQLILDFIQSQQVCSHLEFLNGFLIDPVVQHYTKPLVIALQGARAKSRSALIIHNE